MRIGLMMAVAGVLWLGAGTAAAVPSLHTPSLDTTLTSLVVEFQWSTEAGVTGMAIGVGTTLESVQTPPFGDILYVEHPTPFTRVLAGPIPLTGQPVFVRLWWQIGAEWQAEDYTYQTRPLSSVHQVMLAWDASPTPDVTYRLCLGNGTVMQDPEVIDQSFGCQETAGLRLLVTEYPEETPIHARVYAVTTAGTVSGPSNGVDFQITALPPPDETELEPPVNLRQTTITTTTTTTTTTTVTGP